MNTTTPTNYANLYRAFVSPHDYRGTELTVYVEAHGRNAALQKIAKVIAALEWRGPDDVRDRIYNLSSGQELIDDHLSENIELRLFETGSHGGRPLYAEHPLFLVRNPAPLFAKWLQTQRPNAALLTREEFDAQLRALGERMAADGKRVIKTLLHEAEHNGHTHCHFDNWPEHLKREAYRHLGVERVQMYRRTRAESEGK